MAYQNIDPYASDHAPGIISTGMNVAGSLANPINWYKYSPNMYSITRGDVKVPFRMGRSGISYLKNRTVDIFKNSKGLGGALGAINETRKAVWDVAKPRFADEAGDWLNRNSKSFIGDMSKKGSRTNRRWDLLQRAKTELIESGHEDAAGLIDSFFKNKSDATPKNFKSAMGSNIKRKMPITEKRVFHKTLKGIQRNATAKKEFAEMTANITSGGKVMKFGKSWLGRAGLTVAKGASFIALASAFVDVVNLFAIPLGEAAVGGIDSSLSRLRDRFAPEMTRGRLHPSFISKGAATERQRAIHALSKAGLNARSGFGQEAMMVHQ